MKINFFLTSCFFLCFNLSASEVKVLSKAVSFHVYQAKAIAFSYNDFSLNTKRIDCFKVSIGFSENEIRVSFLFNDSVKISGDEITFGLSAEEIQSCGSSVNYFFDDRGVFLRKSFNS
jgi:hypothetical protein